MRQALGIILLFLAIGCGRVALYNDLSQEDANKVLVLLQQNGIDATLEKETRQNEIFWSILIDQKQLAQARNLIVGSQIISPRAPGLKEVYQQKGGGWIKTPAEERARYLLALKGEIVNSLKHLPGVIDVDVVLNIPLQDEFGLNSERRPTASVVIKSEAPAKGESALNEVEIQKFVSNAVEGMTPRDVAVLLNFVERVGQRLHPGETTVLPLTSAKTEASEEAVEPGDALMGLKLDIASKEKLKVYLIVFFAVLILLSIALIVVVVYNARVRQELKELQAGKGPRLLEGQVTPTALSEGAEREEEREEG